MQSKLLAGLLLFTFVGISFYYLIKSPNENRIEREKFSAKGNLAIGIIKSRSYSKPESISFSYILNEVEMKGGDTKFYMDKDASEVFHDKDKSKPGNKFLVIYDSDDPKKSIIRLDYPITDSSDFQRYVKEFEQMRKTKTY